MQNKVCRSSDFLEDLILSRFKITLMRLAFTFIFTLFLFFTSKAQQQYVSTKLFDMATTAEKIVYGSIVKMDEKFFFIEGINEKGKQEKVKITKYVSRSNAYRWDKYEVGQKVFLFLKRVNGDYAVMSNGEEGELAILKDSVVVPMKSFTLKTNQNLAGGADKLNEDYRNKQSFMVGNKKVFGLRFSVRYFYRSVLDFRDCYQVILKRPNTSASTTCFNFFDRYSRDKINGYKKKSLLLKLMYNDMEEAQKTNCKQP